MAWPTPQDYNEAIQSPQLCFSDPELQRGTPELTKLGLPRPIAGGFAVVYRIKSGNKDWAVRCFLRDFPDQQMRYSAISQHLNSVKLTYTVDFTFLSDGIKIRGKWHPILKMEWVQGDTLLNYIEKNKDQSLVLLELSNRWIKMLNSLQTASVAHGDLQDGNILIVNNDFKLIDYDGMYVPSLKGKTSNEVGHRNYQHPLRSTNDFGVHIDNFSAWVIYLSILALSVDPSLWIRIGVGDGQLLFRREDFNDPNSNVLQMLDQSSNQMVKLHSAFFRTLYHLDISNIPNLDGNQVKQSIPIKSQDNTKASWLKDHMQINGSSKALAPDNIDFDINQGGSWILDHTEKLVPLTITTSLKQERIISSTFLLITASLAGLAIPGLIAPLISIATFIGLIGLTFTYFNRRYRSLPEVKEKLEISLNINRISKVIKGSENQINSLGDKKRKREQEVESNVKQIKSRQNGNGQKEKNESDSLEKDLQNNLRKINTAKQSLNQEENNELKETLNNYKKNFLLTELQKYSINSSNISGIGTEMKRRLSAEGIKTAGDFTGFQSVNTGYGKYASVKIYILTTRNGKVHVEGIGPVKASTLEAWRAGLESKCRGKMPNSLSQTDMNNIKAKYQMKLQNLNSEEIRAKQKATQDKNNIQIKYRKENEMLLAQIKSLQDNLSNEQQKISQDINGKNKALSQNKWELAKLENERNTMRNVNIKGYLKRIIMVKRRSI